jgi:hypothetical protein
MFELVLKEINNGLDILPRKFSHEEIGNIVGLKRNTVTEILNSDRECTSFIIFLQLSKLVNPRNYINQMSLWSRLFRKTENVKYSLEFLSANRNFKALIDYINEIRLTGSKKLQSILDAYELIAEYQSTVKVPKDFIDKIYKLRETVPEARFLKKMLEVYYYNDFSEMNKIADKLQEAEELLQKVEKESLRSMYEIRLIEMKSTYTLFKSNDTQGTREYCRKIMDKIDFYGATYEANVYYKIGMSYFFEDSDLCLFNLRKAAELYRENGDIDFAHNIERNETNLAKVFWGKITDVEEVKGTSSEAHYLAMIGRKEEALEVIDRLDADSPFTRYYRGLAEDNPFLLCESFKLLRDKGNALYEKLPMIALEKYPEAKGLLKLL